MPLEGFKDYLCHVRSGELPGTLVLGTAEFSGDTAWHDVGDTNVVVSNLLHECLAEPHQTKLGGVVSGSMRKGINPGQTPYINDESSSIFLHLRDGEVTAVENTVKIGGQRVPPFLKRHLLNGPKDTDPCVVDLDIDSTQRSQHNAE